MTIRTVRPEELEECCAPDNRLAGVVRLLWKEGRCSPDLCFVAERSGRLVGRVFLHHESSSAGFDLFGLHIDPSVDYLDTGRKLLSAALARLVEKGATAVSDAIYDIYEARPAQRQALLESLGFRQFQEKRRYVWRDPGALIAVPTRLDFRSLAQVGEDAFREAVRRVTDGTLDRSIQSDIAKSGLGEASREYVETIKDLEFLPDQWQLGYLADGGLCGLVVPQLNRYENEGTINYVGVVPEQRGSGYGFDLLMRGTALLQQRGINVVVAETDILNQPVHVHLERVGYRHEGTLRGFSLTLTQSAGS